MGMDTYPVFKLCSDTASIQTNKHAYIDIHMYIRRNRVAHMYIKTRHAIARNCITIPHATCVPLSKRHEDI